jgi:hypothetical protein
MTWHGAEFEACESLASHLRFIGGSSAHPVHLQILPRLPDESERRASDDAVNKLPSAQARKIEPMT